MREGTIVAVGTAKGAFLITEEGLAGPFFPGDRVPAFAIDTRHDPPRMLAGTVSDHWGPGVRTSADLGGTWSDPAERALRFPQGTDAALAQVWQLQPGPPDAPDVVYAGVEPAALFRSDDGGDTWTLERGLWDHPHRTQWMPGGGGLGLHTILLDPRDPMRVHIAISAGGVYRSDDGGATWEPRNQGVRLAGGEDEPVQYPEFGQCVHKLARDGADPDRIYMQNHGGLYRSDDRADSWNDIANGVPSDFGFPMVAHPRRGGVAYAIPLESAEYRCTPEGRCRVYRTEDAGASWAPAGEGLPTEHAHVTVLRDAFCVGLYFGTRGGQVFASEDEGSTWNVLAEFLPAVLCVRAAQVG